jgi:hypothetical protein
MDNIIGYCLENVNGVCHSFVTSDYEAEVQNKSNTLCQKLHQLVSLNRLVMEANKHIDSTMKSIDFWDSQYQTHQDAASYRCYSRALVKAITEINIIISLLDLVQYRLIVDMLVAKLDALDKKYLDNHNSYPNRIINKNYQ